MQRVRNETRSSGPRLRTLALPAEHGSWSLTLEPILLGLLVAPSWGGAALALGSFATFLLRVPLKAAFASRRQGRTQRMKLALRVAAVYALVAAAGVAAAVAWSGLKPLWPLLLALPFGIVFFVHDAQNQSRSWQAELAGPMAFGAIASCIALAGGWSTAPALALWGVLIARALTSILYIRTRLRLDRGRPAQPGPAIVAHGIALAAVAALASMGLLPFAVVGVFVLVAARTAWGLSPYRRRVSVPVLGMAELVWGLVTVLSVALGVRL